MEKKRKLIRYEEGGSLFFPILDGFKAKKTDSRSVNTVIFSFHSQLPIDNLPDEGRN